MRPRGEPLAALLAVFLAACPSVGIPPPAPPPNEPAPASPSATVRGVIRDLEGRPVEGGEAYFYDDSDTRRPADFISSRSGADGRYRAVVPAGSYQVVARVRRGGRFGPLRAGDRHSGAPRPLKVREGAVADLDFVVAGLREAARRRDKVRPDHFAVSGRVTSPKGAPLAERYVVARLPGAESVFPKHLSTWTDAAGRFSLYLPAGEYRLAVASRFPPSAALVEVRVLSVSGDVHDLDIRSQP